MTLTETTEAFTGSQQQEVSLWSTIMLSMKHDTMMRFVCEYLQGIILITAQMMATPLLERNLQS